MLDSAATKPALLYCGSFEIPNGNASANRFEANASLFSELGYRVIGVGFHPDGSSETSLAKFPHFLAHLSPRPTGFLPWMIRALFPLSVFRVLRQRRKEKIDFCIVYDFPAIATIWLLLWKKRYGYELILEFTEWYNKPEGWGLRALYKNFDTWLRIRVLSRLQIPVIVASSYLKRRIGTSAPRLLLPSLHTRKEPGQGTAPRGDDLFRFVYAGRPFHDGPEGVDRSSIKERLDLVVELLHEIRTRGTELRLDIFGVTEEAFLSLYPGWEGRMTGWVDFHGNSAHKGVRQVLADTDFTIFFRESSRLTLSGFPSKLSESIIHGVPVVTNFLPNLEDFVSDDIAILFPDCEAVLRNPEILAGRLRRSEVDRMKRHCLRCEWFTPIYHVEPMRRFLALDPSSFNQAS